MKRPCFTLLVTLLSIKVILAQEIRWSHRLTCDSLTISLVDFDNEDNLFTADNEGNITVFYHTSPDSTNLYSPSFQGMLQQLEASKTLNIFTFSRDLQQIEILDRFLKPLYSARLTSSNFGNIRAASLGNNLKIWLFDESNYHLLQWDYQRNTVLQDQPLNLIIPGGSWTVREILESKNMVFINAGEKGIFLLDNQSNYLGNLPIVTDQKLAVHGNHLLHIEENMLIITNYLSGASKKTPLPQPATAVAIGKETVAFYTIDHVSSYDLPDNLFTIE
ncbi:hypothetical protein DN752_18110 [Echinicola strongylocentroti]|uniref:Uncharacterized protein n=1 Tax=Echinicola strongylocentroti TaxID=1795355 RepID=A0A2Z4ILT5_9BACT|nr:hypothetical protein [Echinicola strongylocentroti]AWW31895.1 hypothetical protein DN752_18110 [Echinicola strongylocentroti]